MPTYAPREQNGDRTGASYRKALDAVPDTVTAGLAYLRSASTENRQLIAEGENLSLQSDRAPDGEPPRNWVQTVLKWIKSVMQWGTRHLQNLRRSALASRNNPALERRVNGLERRVDALETKVMDWQESLAAFRREVNERSDAVVIADALVNWTKSPRAWHEILPSALQLAWIETLELWSDRAPTVFWPSLCQRLGVPESLSLQSCAVLTQVGIKGSGAPAPFFIVGEASVNMDSERIRKTLQHVQELGQHTAYPVIPCVCARVYTGAVLAQARAAGVIALQWQRGDIARPIAIPDAVKYFLRF